MTTKSAMRIPDAWIVTGAASILMALTMGSRSVFGLFISPLNSATGLGIATISLVVALSQLTWGAAQPVAGLLSERYGASRVVAAGSLLLALGTALIPLSDSAAGLFFALTLGAVAGAAVGSNAVLLGLVSRCVPDGKRGLAAGVVGAGGSAGQLLIAPTAQAMIAGTGWINAMLALAALSLLALPVALGLRRPEPAPSGADVPSSATARPAAPDAAGGGLAARWALARAALASPGYWIVTGGFFVCGFHVSFLVSHMPGVVEVCGLPASVAGAWLGIVGLCNIVGSIASGWVIERLPMKRVLTALYTARALGVAIFLVLPKNEWTLYAFAVWMGITYMATLPPTAGLIGKLFGVERLATLLGITMFVHQIGGFLGVWLGGVVVARTGSYDVLWLADLALAVVAALIHLPLREAAVVPAAQWRLDSGRVVGVRPVRASDIAAIQAFVRGLSAGSRVRRFFSAIHELDARLLARFAAPDRTRDEVLLAFDGAGTGDEVVAIGQYAGDPAAKACEVAFVVADRWQGQGLGRLLMAKLLERAEQSGYERVQADVLADNRPMLTLARRFGFMSTEFAGGRAIVRVVRSLGRALADRPLAPPSGSARGGTQPAAA
jgi:MFS family permease